MRVLVLGGSGHVGARLCALLRETAWATPVCASRHGGPPGDDKIRLDTRDPQAMRQALARYDAVVNCVAGNAAAIGDGARVLVDAAVAGGCGRLVHLSSMAVYGSAEGNVTEEAPLDGSLGWYAQAKCAAEAQMHAFAAQGGTVTVLRPGCVWGPGSQLWVGRIARLLEARRLGDLGVGGDGWSNLVHVDDVCRAVIAALQPGRAATGLSAYNLAAPDSPRWNEYFVDLALAIGAAPVRRLSSRRLRLDAILAGPPLKIVEVVAKRMLGHAGWVPVPIPPNLHALELEPLAMLPFTVAVDFEGDQWTFFKPPLDDLRALYGVDVQELTVWRPLIEHVEEHLAAGKLISTESDAFWLPDTAGTDYRRTHTKTTILIAELDMEHERAGYFHNAGYHELSGADFRGTFRLDAPQDAAFMPLFAELVRIDRVVQRRAGELADLSLALLRRHHAWRPRSNPFPRFAARLAQDLPDMRERGVEHYHQWAFASTRQAGAAFELLAANLRWLASQGHAPLATAAAPFAAIAQANKTLILKGARAVATGKPLNADDLLQAMADDWESGMGLLQAALDTD